MNLASKTFEAEGEVESLDTDVPVIDFRCAEPANAAADRIGAAIRQAANKRAVRRQLVVALALIDIFLLVSALVVSQHLWLRRDAGLYDFTLTGTVAMLYFALAAHRGAFDVSNLDTYARSARRSLQSLLLTGLLTGLLFFALKIGAEFSRLALLLGFGTAALFIALARYLVQVKRAQVLGSHAPATIAIFDGYSARKTEADLAVIVGGSDFSSFAAGPSVLERMATLLRNFDRAEIFCHQQRRTAWAYMMRAFSIDADIRMPELDDLGPIGVVNDDGRIGLRVSTHALNWHEGLAKRAFDLAFTIPALLVFAPIMLVVAAAVKLTSQGPVFFVQRRVGFDNRSFTILKFRTMHVQHTDKDGVVSASRDDARVTPIGGLLRRTSLDELPQLLNVLMGTMSIVGPRPHAHGSRAGDQLFWEVDANYWHRHRVKPGLTGLAQVRGFRGATDEAKDLENRLRSDIEYLDNWSLAGDLAILARTFRVLIHNKAY